MSSELTWHASSHNLDETLRIASQIGERLRGGEVIELVSDLGGGKTAFVRGLAQGAESSDDVSSPSFTLTNEYATHNFRIHHYDLYRLREAGIMSQELREVCGDPKNVVIIEWATIVSDVLPAEHVVIHIQTTGDTERTLTATYPEQYKYLFPDNT